MQNSKQAYSDSVFWIFRAGDLFVSEFVSVRRAAFDIRISEFVLPVFKRDQWTGWFKEQLIFHHRGPARQSRQKNRNISRKDAKVGEKW
jgi:hypothetical protein